MTPTDHFSEVKRVFLLAISEPPRNRGAVLHQECGRHPLVRQEVGRLLKLRRRAGGFLRHAAHPPASASFQGTPRFEIKRKLGSGGFGDVYHAYDRDLAADVALKILRQFGPASLTRFKDEFRSLQGVNHPNLIQFYELIFDRDSLSWFITMELLDGVPFLDALPRSDQDLNLLRPALLGLATGIHALHQHGIVHCDIKPSNVLVTGDGRVVLLDFGLARRFLSSSRNLISRQRTATLMGTPDYVAPEQIAGGEITSAADWYSAGVVLYQALTGGLPFQGNAWEVMTRKQNHEPVFQRTSPAQRDLMDLCRRMLARDPLARPTGMEILQILAGDQSSKTPRIVREPGSREQFFGRTRELGELQIAFRRAQIGETVSLHVSGSSGMGKTSLIRHFLAALQERDPNLLLLTGKCHEGESVPYNALDEIVDGLRRVLDALPAAELDAIAPRSLPVLSKLFPVLEQTAALVRLRRGIPEIVDSQGLRRFAFDVFRELLARLSDRRPVVVFIDDLQWGDLDSSLLLQQLVNGPDTPRILFIFAYRREDAAESETIQSLLSLTPKSCLHSIDLAPLSDSDTRQLTRAILSSQSETQIDEIVRESEGSPFFTRELAHYIREGGVRHGNARPRVESAILQRVERLPETARQVLQFVAVAGAPISLASVRLAGQLTGDLQAARNLLVAQSLLRVRDPQAGVCETYHDRVRESVVAGIPSAELRSCHERLALALEPHAAPEVVAIHYREAGRFPQAGQYAKTGADQAMRALAFERAARLYGWALDWCAADSVARAHLESRRGDALAGWGRGVEAAWAYERAASTAAPSRVLPLRIRCAAELLRAGEVRDGLARLRSLLHQYGLPFPEKLHAVIARLLWERVRLNFHGFRIRKQNSSARFLDRLDVCWAAAIGMGMVDPALTEIYCAIYLRLALNAGEPVRLTMALAAWASRLAYKDDGHLRKARAMMQRAEQLLAHSPEAYSRAFVAQMWSVIELLGGNWRPAQEWAAKALSIYRTECTGVAWETATAANILFTSRSMRGHWTENRQELPALVQAARERGDRYAEVSLPILTGYYSCYLASDEPDEGERMIDDCIAAWSHERFDMERITALIAKVEFDSYRGEAARAWQRIDEAWPQINRSGALMLTMTRIFAEALRGRVALGFAATMEDSRRRRPLLAVARKAAKKLERSPARYANAFALLLRAGLAGLGESASGTRALLEQAEKELQSADLIPWLAVTRLRLAELQSGDQALRTRNAATEWFESQQVRRPECLVKMLLPCV